MKKGFVIYVNNVGILSHKLIDFLSTCQVDEETLRFLIKELEVLEPTEEEFNEFWRVISREQKLSENFMEEFKDYLDWYEISEHQKLSENFIRKHIYRIKSSIRLNFSICQDDFSDELKNMLNEKFKKEEELKKLKEVENEIINVSRRLGTYLLDNAIKIIREIIEENQK